MSSPTRRPHTNLTVYANLRDKHEELEKKYGFVTYQNNILKSKAEESNRKRRRDNEIIKSQEEINASLLVKNDRNIELLESKNEEIGILNFMLEDKTNECKREKLKHSELEKRFRLRYSELEKQSSERIAELDALIEGMRSNN